MRDDIWVEEDDDDRRRPRSVLAILAVAAIPWAIVAAIVLFPDRDTAPGTGADATVEDHPASSGDDRADGGAEGGAEEGAASAEAPSAAQDGRSTSPRDMPDGSGGDGARGSVDDGRGAVANGLDVPGDLGRSGDLALAATATVVARAWATGIDPTLDVPGVEPEQRPRYAEHVTVEAIDHAGPGFAVVTLVAVVLEDLEDGLGADLRRIAVPLAVGDGAPRLAGVPWWLPPPTINPAEVATEPASDPTLRASAADALQRAGYLEVEVQSLHRTPGWPWIVGFTAVAPGGERVSGEVWLRQGEGGFHLAGHVPDDAHEDGGR